MLPFKLNKKLFIPVILIFFLFQIYKNVNIYRKKTQITNDTIEIIDKTADYRFFDNIILGYRNNIYLSKYDLHYCNIDENIDNVFVVITFLK